MSLDLKEIRKTVIDSIKLSIGDKLTQTTNPQTQTTYGLVLNSRPNPEISVPDYPYAVLDVLGIKDTDWYVTQTRYDPQTDKHQYETHKTIEMQVTIFGGDALSLAEELCTSYRREDVLNVLIGGGLGLADVQPVQILPELLQTDFLEVAFITLTVRANDVYVDPNLESIEHVISDGTLLDAGTGDTLEIHLDVDSTP